MNRLCLLAFAFSFIATAAPLPLHSLPILPVFAVAATESSSPSSAVVKPDMLCNAIQELDHDVCGNVAQAPLCRVLSELNSTLCLNVKDRVFAHTGETLCPLLMFVDEALCSNATTATTATTATNVDTAHHDNKLKLNPAEFCPIIELADKELCGGSVAAVAVAAAL